VSSRALTGEEETKNRTVMIFENEYHSDDAPTHGKEELEEIGE